MPQKWSKEIIVHHISLHRDGGGDLSSAMIRRRYRKLYAAAIRQFGSWDAAVESAKSSMVAVSNSKELSPNQGSRATWNSWNESKVIQEIQKLNESGSDLSSRYQQKNNPSLYKSGWRYFGGWRQAITAVGINYESVSRIPTARKWNRNKVVAEVHDRANKNLSLEGVLMRKEDRGFYDAAVYHCGSWLNALRSAGIEVRRPRNWWTEGRILGHIRLLNKVGRDLSSTSMRETHLQLFSAALKRFGNWGRAVELAGASYQRHLRRWSTKAWLRRIAADEYQTILHRAQTHAEKRRRMR